MTQPFDPLEPLPDHLADTGPIRRVNVVPGWRRAVGFFSLLGAAGLTVATALLLLSPGSSPEPNPAPETTIPATISADATASPLPTLTPDTAVAQANDLPPVMSPEGIDSVLAAPIQAYDQRIGWEVARDDFSAFTIIPNRPRSEVIQYEVQSGDTIFQIAERFGLKPESIAWANDRTIVEALRPGRVLNILPVDGVYMTVASAQTVASIASRYAVDPYAIIDSEFNPDLFGATPDTELPSGTRVVIPGGVDSAINWNPPVTRIPGSSSSSGSSTGAMISFDPSSAGSCGLVSNPGGGTQWRKPLANYQWVRGFTSYHSGVDLSASVGAPVMAANGGTVIFAGWSSWGYGYAVVLAHGPYTTLYGHLSAVNARCGAFVNAGQVIGAVGSTGDSSGPHLHFEIRYNDIPTDPLGTMPF